MADFWIGCSGFHYQHWKGIFYPEELAKSKWFDYYNNRFKTLELNTTFYRFPRLSFLQPWYDKSPDYFRFSVKAPRAITHYRKFINTEQWMRDFYATIQEGLREKLACVLFQLPPTMAYKEDKLQQIIDSLDPTFVNVLECRHESWWNQEVYNRLAAAKITFCGMSHPGLPAEVVQNTGTLYYRLHGTPELYKSKYDPATLVEISNEIDRSSAVAIAYIYFNNDIDGSAITNAFQMEAYIEKLQKGIGINTNSMQKH